MSSAYSTTALGFYFTAYFQKQTWLRLHQSPICMAQGHETALPNWLFACIWQYNSSLLQIGGRSASQLGMPYANLQTMPQYTQHSNAQYTRPSSVAPEVEHKPDPEALLAYIRQSASSSASGSQNPTQQAFAPFQGQQQVISTSILVEDIILTMLRVL